MRAKQTEDNHAYARNSRSQRLQFYIWGELYQDIPAASSHSYDNGILLQKDTFVQFLQVSNSYCGCETYLYFGLPYYGYPPFCSPSGKLSFKTLANFLAIDLAIIGGTALPTC